MSSPWPRIWRGVVNHQHFIWPILLITGIGVLQQIVPWYIVWAAVAAAGYFMYSRIGARKAAVKAEEVKVVDMSKNTGDELLQEFEAEERRKKEEAERAYAQKRAAIAARSSREIVSPPAKTKKSAEEDFSPASLATFAKTKLPPALAAAANSKAKSAQTGAKEAGKKAQAVVAPSYVADDEDAAPVTSATSGSRKRRGAAPTDGDWQTS